MEQEQTAGRVTLDGVRAAVEKLGGDPARTNAAKVREVLGRGGFGTIQKHLERLRAERLAPEVDENDDEAPDAPKDLVQGIWAAAWAEASRQQERALRLALARASEAEERLGVALDDLEGLAENLDRLEGERNAAVERAEAAEKILEEERQAIAGERAALGAMMEQLRGMLSASSNKKELPSTEKAAPDNHSLFD